MGGRDTRDDPCNASSFIASFLLYILEVFMIRHSVLAEGSGVSAGRKLADQQTSACSGYEARVCDKMCAVGSEQNDPSG